MASILRSSKFVRYIAGFARHIINTPREVDGNLVNSAQCYSCIIPRSLTTQVSPQHDRTIDESLRKIDQDVKRSGRISRRDIEDVLEEIRTTRSATTSQSLLVIRCCGNLVPEELPEFRTQLVEEIWNTLIKLNVPIDISHYNALLRVYLENEHQFSPAEFLNQLELKGIEPNRVTYQRLITRYCQLADIEGATKILEYMRQKQLPVNENVFNALIMGHSQSGDMESARGILVVMAQAGLEPSADTYTTLLSGYAKAGDMQKIDDILKECEEKDVYLLDKDYLDIAYALIINGHDEYVPQIFSKVRKAFGYNQDAINLILRLINKGFEKSAITVLKTMIRGNRSDGTLQPTGNFLIKQVVKAKRPPESIIEVCQILENDSMYERGLELAAETSLQLGYDGIAYALLEELQNRGQEIRQHFFWPLIVAKADDASGDGIIEVLMRMASFNLTPNSETLRDYVIPNIRGSSIDIISKLRQGNISIGSSASNLVHSLLLKGNMEEAKLIVSSITAYYPPNVLKRPLTHSFYKRQDYKSYVTILRYIFENLDRRDNVRSENDDSKDLDKNQIMGQFLIDLTGNRLEFPNVAHNVLDELVKKGLSISSDAAERIQDALGEKLTPEISSTLGKLTSGELTPEPVERKPPMYTPAEQMNVPQLERLIHNLSAQNRDVTGLKRQLLNLYCRAKETENVENLLKELENENFHYSVGVYAQLIELYTYHDRLDEALNYYSKLKEFDASFALEDFRVVRLAHLLTKNNRFDEAIELLKSQDRSKRAEEQTFSYRTSCWRFLNSLAEEGRVDDLATLFKTLVDLEYIETNNVMLGPLIKVHLIKDDVDKALEQFEWCCKQYHATPWKNELTRKLIENEDAEKLQKLTDLSTLVHGEINSLYDLVFAFVECGRVRQARKILETPGLHTRPQRINNACQRYQIEGMVKPLEGLKDATKDLNHIDRSDIYYQLLLSYIKQQDIDRAMGLWTQMQEEDLAPTDMFLHTLGSFLQNKGVHVPFAIPSVETDAENVIAHMQPATPTRAAVSSQIYAFRQAFQSGDYDKALEIKSSINERMSHADISLFIEALVKKDRLEDASVETMRLLRGGHTPLARVFRFLLNKLAANGKVDELNTIGSLISNDVKKMVSFDNKVCHANCVAGRADEYLNKLEHDIDNAKAEDINELGDKFPRGGILGILEKRPELIEKFEGIAIKYAKRGIISPLNVLWCQYFIDNEAKANQIWTEYLQTAPRVMFQKIVHHARNELDEELIRKLISHLQSTTISDGAMGNAYSCLLDILAHKAPPENVISEFEDILNKVKIDSINRTALVRVRQLYHSLQKPFNYVIPFKNPPKAFSNREHDTEF